MHSKGSIAKGMLRCKTGFLHSTPWYELLSALQIVVMTVIWEVIETTPVQEFAFLYIPAKSVYIR